MSLRIVNVFRMPAKTAAERQREPRARLRNSADQSDLEAYKKADRERKRKRKYAN